jgi:hypothetical protein
MGARSQAIKGGRRLDAGAQRRHQGATSGVNRGTGALMRKHLLATVLACLLAQPASAYTVRGVGADKCALWLYEKAGTEKDRQYITWILGFVSGLEGPKQPGKNQGTSQIKNMDVIRVANAWCANHPMQDVANAAEAASWALEKDAPSPQQTPEVDYR